MAIGLGEAAPCGEYAGMPVALKAGQGTIHRILFAWCFLRHIEASAVIIVTIVTIPRAHENFFDQPQGEAILNGLFTV